MTAPATQDCFRALADPTRRDILMMLRSREMTIAQVAERFTMTRAAVKKHLSVLAAGGLIEVHTNGRTRVNQINPEGMAPILNWLEFFDSFWDDRLSALKTAIEKDENHD